MKRTLKRITTLILITLIIFNFIYGNWFPSNAADSIGESAINLITNLLGGVAGLFTLVIRLPAMALALGVNILTAQVAYMDGVTNTASGGLLDRLTVTPFEIFFNELQILDVNFLDTNVGGTTGTIRKAVAQWYYVMRLIASIILLVILIFVGVKMAISSVADEKAKYKRTLVDWATSLALVFLMQYIIMFTVNANSAIVAAMKSVVDSSDIQDAIGAIGVLGLGISFESMAATVVYCLIIFQTLVFLVTYIKRMLTVGFLIIISPLISITYSIDKMGDGKAQALNTWLKEFIYNVLIQPFHCVMYMAFVGTAFEILSRGDSLSIWDALPISLDSGLANAIIAILCMKFIDDGEKIIRKIFGFDQASSVSPLAIAATAGFIKDGGKKLAGAATSARKGINMAKKNGFIPSAKKDISAVKSSAFAKKTSELGSKIGKAIGNSGVGKAAKTFGTNVGNKAQELGKGLATPIREMAKTIENNRIEKEKQANPNKYSGKSPQEANEAAKAAVAEKRKASKDSRVKIVGAVGNAGGKIVKGAGDTIKAGLNSNVGRYFRRMIPAGIGLGFGLMGFGSSNVLAAITAGTGVANGLTEFNRTSTSNLARESAKFLNGRTSNSEELGDHLIDVEQTGESGGYNQGSEEMKKVVDELRKVLTSLGQADKLKRIEYSIGHNAINNPESLDVGKILEKAIGNDSASTPELMSAAQNLANFDLDANLYKNMQSGLSIGMSVEDFTKKLSGYTQFSSGQSAYGGAETGAETGAQRVEISSVVENIQRTENITETITEVKSDLKPEEIQALIPQLDSRIQELNSAIQEAQNQGTSQSQKIIKEYKDQIANLDKAKEELKV